MVVLSWNCNGALRKKYHLLLDINPDVIIIQECENPEQVKYSSDFFEYFPYYLWTGENKNKGLGIFSKYKLIENHWNNQNTKYFISCEINNSFNLLGVWCHQANSPTFEYIGQFWKYLKINKNNFKEKEILIGGDFNSNKQWDLRDRWWDHSDVVKELDQINIKSLYHEFFQERQGEEKKPTFFHRKNEEKSYHIDYFFGSQKFSHSIKSLTIGDYNEWKSFSDHIPLFIEI